MRCGGRAFFVNSESAPRSATFQVHASDGDVLLDLRGLGKELGRSVRSIRRFVSANGPLAGIPSITIGNRRLWRRSALFEFVASHETLSGRIAPRRTRRRKVQLEK